MRQIFGEEDISFCKGEEKEGKYLEKENIFFLEEKKTTEGKGGKYLEEISQVY